MSSPAPTISVVIPAYNGAAYIQTALKAVQAQTYKPLEIIVVDDGSQDATPALVEGMAAQLPPGASPIKLIRQTNAGTQAARNRGIRAALGDYIALLDQDDSWLPPYLEQFSAHLRPNRVLFANYQIIDEAGRVVKPAVQVRAAQMRLPYILYGNYVFLSGCLFPRQLWEKVGEFDTELIATGDWDWLVRVILAGGQIEPVPLPPPAVLWQYRIHNSNTTRNHRLMMGNTFTTLDKTFQQPNFPARYRKYQPHAYYINAVLAAGKFYAVKDTTTATSYLTQARQVSPTEFFSLQTFISFLKIYSQTAEQPLTLIGPDVVEFVASQPTDPAEQMLLTRLGRLALALLMARAQPWLALKQIGQSWRFWRRPGAVLIPLANYLLIYLRQLFNQFSLRLRSVFSFQG